MARHYRRNPSLFTRDKIEDYAITGAGLIATQVAEQQVVLPLAQKFLPSLIQSGSASGKVADVVATGLTAWGLEKGLDMLGQPGLGEQVGFGGGMATVFKAAGFLVPGLVLNVQVPQALSLGGIVKTTAPAVAGASAPAAVGAGSGMTGGGLGGNVTNAASAAALTSSRSVYGRIQSM